jgi:S-DNA-T family DNA segregation ATPase FtsK/SpoIIIE
VSVNAYDRDVLRSQMEQLRRAAASRAALEREIATEHDTETRSARTEADRRAEEIRRQAAGQIDATERDYAAVLEKTRSTATAEQHKLDTQRQSLTETLTAQAADQEQKAREDEQFESSSAREVFREKRKDPDRLRLKTEKDFEAAVGQIGQTATQVRSFLTARGIAQTEAAGDGGGSPTAADLACGGSPAAADPACGGSPAAADPACGGSPAAADPLAEFERLRADIAAGASGILGLPAARRAFGSGSLLAALLVPLVLAVLVGLGLTVAGGFALPLAATVAGGVAAGGLGLALPLLFRWRSAVRRRLTALGSTFQAHLERARGLEQPGREFIARRRDAQLAKLEQSFKQENATRQSQLEARLADITRSRDKGRADLETKYTQATAKLADKVAAAVAAAEAKFPARLAALAADRDGAIADLERARDERIAAADRRRDERLAAMTADWRQVREATAAVWDEANRLDAAAFPGWDDLAREEVPLPEMPPPGLRFGDLSLSLAAVPGGIAPTPALNAFGPVEWRQPATLPWPVQASLVVRTAPEQKETSSAFMQALMLRIAAGIPAGQSRFTIIDPLGLGKQFAGFMHLADYDELLVNSRIWTEPQLIEEKLGEITDQMEVVIQKYLRNEYASIGDYNADAEVPEPYKFVVAANFPANFTETSARRLASIAASGPRCGVYVIVSVDPKQAMPAGFSLAELDQHATRIVLADGRFTWDDPEFAKWPLSVEQPPSDEVFTKIIQRVGKAAKAAKRVVVPFDRVAPPEPEWWQGSTASEVLAPLGPAGAKKLQYLRLGKGTSQHALIAGKTGSGKSTLMHAMITSLALQYSPNEIQFYLIDFKKGVEFKLYDHYALPHARVIAIESEREFGLSVLQQLDAELKRRGDLFRELSVQDVAGFRRTGHADPMPRILLLIDEFQEMFVEDDKLAQDASLILDRLVRQGRAFGMHVLLGSQTLGGSYSLPRATMGQMAVRVALQCNEADSSLILSEDNTAARLLTRPGEAIYNDANGMVEGNNPFQVVFLDEDRREHYLGALRRLADSRTDIPQLTRIVFDGNEAAAPGGNRLLGELLATGTVQGREPVAALAWLGDAIAIKDPTAALFRRQGGANLLVVGQREDLGASLLAMSLVSLAAGLDPHPGGGLGRPGRFVLFEPAIAEEKPDIMLERLAAHLPHEIEVVGRLAVGDACRRLAGEVKRRLDEQVLDGEAVFVIVRDLARFRELRKGDGDFGFSFGGGEKEAGPADNFMTVLRDGPTVGIHTLIWCDSLTNLQRTFDRTALREFELRVLFQMSSSDSSQLVDSPLAAKLGPQRALFVHEETGTLEKFRPYAFPTPEWLADVGGRMRSRPQGDPAAPRAAASTGDATGDATGQATAAAAGGGGTDGGPAGLGSLDFGGGFGDFNFAKMLDDMPGGKDAGATGTDATPPPTG